MRTKDMGDIKDLEEFRKKVKEQRDREWIRDAIRLREKTPEESLRMMFDLIKFAEKVSKAKKFEPES